MSLVAPAPGAARPFHANVSVVVLNYDRVATTLQCLDALDAASSGLIGEVLVVDNGSPPEALDQLAAGAAGRARVVPVGVNRYFGEGNNIGAEEATGDYVVFLNNDAFVQPGWIEELAATMAADPGVAAVGPMFVYPDGRVQEVGGLALPTGDVVQVGKGAVWPADHYTEPCPVDFCSAACLLVRAADFQAVGGFGFEFEPAYYEDVDLCLKLWAAHGVVMVNPRARVVHIESHTTSDASLQLHSISEINRQKFVERWGAWLRGRRLLGTAAEGISRELPAAGAGWDAADASGDAGAGLATPAVQQARRRFPPRVHGAQVPRAVLYSPFELVPGGGERVLFELAGYLSGELGPAHVAMAGSHRYSTTRLSQLGRVFGFGRPVAHPRILADVPTGRVELGVVLGNSIVPPVPPFGRRSVYLCQFPFAVSDQHVAAHRHWLAGFDEIWVYSRFVRRYVAGLADLYGIEHGPVRVVHPPAQWPGADASVPWADRRTVLTVGRFFTGGHDKRQDVVIDTVRHLAANGHPDIHLAVAGSMHATDGSRARYHQLVEMADGLHCSFHPNADRRQLARLYARSAVLVHAAGFGTDPLEFPERLEHFGITPVEAASFGCIPVAFREGGPAEVLDLLGCDTGFRTRPEAAAVLSALWDDPEGSAALSASLPDRTEQFSVAAFHRNVGRALQEVAARP